ncbi:MAG: YHS domain-containing (seleno)protein [Pseudomonadota bacterium]
MTAPTFSRAPLFSILAALFMFLAVPAQAAKDPVYTPWLSDVGASGYDVVAYFTEGKPVEGSDAFTADYNGAEWHFSSAENRDAFAADPAKYAPQYGGYCAYAVSQGYTASTVPEAWKIVDGKLYLNYSLSVRDLWEEDIPGNIAAADGNWPKVLEE